MTIKTISWKNNTVVLIDQNALPQIERQVVCSDYRQVISAIKDLTVRGAPAIGVAAAMGLALGAVSLLPSSAQKFRKQIIIICDQIAAARPTARNLFWALERMKKCLDDAIISGKQNLATQLVSEAKRICAEDITINRQIGKHGNMLIADGDNILTHCNTGALATAGYGTALGVIRAARKQGKKLHVYVDETRPLLQGSRLTAWEMQKEKIPATLITDNMAGFLMQQGKIDKIIVGADRIAANGDTANKIGTYSLAVLAVAHGIPFYVAAPLSTFDFSLKTGTEIPIEERSADEVTHFRGIAAAPRGMKVYNPAFDLTEARYISAIITEEGIITKPYRTALARIARKNKS
ncbi:MAG: S-methyl-5-thioribose-1-phosphate isomerase [Deltaproteobacteria bacterium]